MLGRNTIVFVVTHIWVCILPQPLINSVEIDFLPAKRVGAYQKTNTKPG
jgi:hypothetical protein